MRSGGKCKPGESLKKDSRTKRKSSSKRKPKPQQVQDTEHVEDSQDPDATQVETGAAYVPRRGSGMLSTEPPLFTSQDDREFQRTREFLRRGRDTRDDSDDDDNSMAIDIDLDDDQDLLHHEATEPIPRRLPLTPGGDMELPDLGERHRHEHESQTGHR